jgi:hypothetical protein
MTMGGRIADRTVSTPFASIEEKNANAHVTITAAPRLTVRNLASACASACLFLRYLHLSTRMEPQDLAETALSLRNRHSHPSRFTAALIPIPAGAEYVASCQCQRAYRFIRGTDDPFCSSWKIHRADAGSNRTGRSLPFREAGRLRSSGRGVSQKANCSASRMSVFARCCMGKHCILDLRLSRLD